MNPIWAAVITGSATVLAALLSSIITRYGVSLWRRPVAIRCHGRANEMRAIGQGPSTKEPLKSFDYDMSECLLTIRGAVVEFAGKLTMKDGDSRVVHGRISGKGRFEHGWAFMVYHVSDTTRQQAWAGLGMLRVPGFGPLDGYWMTQDSVEKGRLAVGEFRFEREEIT